MLGLVLVVYALSYVAFRMSHREVWENEGEVYVIFPAEAAWLYYFYRPASYLDASLTGMHFHIGPHH